MKMENEEDDDMGLQLALKKARKLKQLEKIERKPDLVDALIVCIFSFVNAIMCSLLLIILLFMHINSIIYNEHRVKNPIKFDISINFFRNLNIMITH